MKEGELTRTTTSHRQLTSPIAHPLRTSAKPVIASSFAKFTYFTPSVCAQLAMLSAINIDEKGNVCQSKHLDLAGTPAAAPWSVTVQAVAQSISNRSNRRTRRARRNTTESEAPQQCAATAADGRKREQPTFAAIPCASPARRRDAWSLRQWLITRSRTRAIRRCSGAKRTGRACASHAMTGRPLPRMEDGAIEGHRGG